MGCGASSVSVSPSEPKSLAVHGPQESAPLLVRPIPFSPHGHFICRFCGGASCKHEDWTKQRGYPTSCAIKGLNSSFITRQIIAMQRPSTRLIEEHGIMFQMQSLSVGAIFNLQVPGEHPLCGDKLDSDSGFSYHPEDFHKHGIVVYNQSWVDMGIPSPSLMLTIVQLIDRHVTNLGEAVAVHCHAGYGRTGLAIACWLMFAQGCSAEEAIRQVRQERPACIQTATQIAYVTTFKAFLVAIYRQFLPKVVYAPTLRPSDTRILPSYTHSPPWAVMSAIGYFMLTEPSFCSLFYPTDQDNVSVPSSIASAAVKTLISGFQTVLQTRPYNPHHSVLYYASNMLQSGAKVIMPASTAPCRVQDAHNVVPVTVLDKYDPPGLYSSSCTTPRGDYDPLSTPRRQSVQSPASSLIPQFLTRSPSASNLLVSLDTPRERVAQKLRVASNRVSTSHSPTFKNAEETPPLAMSSSDNKHTNVMLPDWSLNESELQFPNNNVSMSNMSFPPENTPRSHGDMSMMDESMDLNNTSMMMLPPPMLSTTSTSNINTPRTLNATGEIPSTTDSLHNNTLNITTTTNEPVEYNVSEHQPTIENAQLIQSIKPHDQNQEAYLASIQDEISALYQEEQSSQEQLREALRLQYEVQHGKEAKELRYTPRLLHELSKLLPNFEVLLPKPHHVSSGSSVFLPVHNRVESRLIQPSNTIATVCSAERPVDCMADHIARQFTQGYSRTLLGHEFEISENCLLLPPSTQPIHNGGLDSTLHVTRKIQASPARRTNAPNNTGKKSRSVSRSRAPSSAMSTKHSPFPVPPLRLPKLPPLTSQRTQPVAKLTWEASHEVQLLQWKKQLNNGPFEILQDLSNMMSMEQTVLRGKSETLGVSSSCILREAGVTNTSARKKIVTSLHRFISTRPHHPAASAIAAIVPCKGCKCGRCGCEQTTGTGAIIGRKIVPECECKCKTMACSITITPVFACLPISAGVFSFTLLCDYLNQFSSPLIKVPENVIKTASLVYESHWNALRTHQVSESPWWIPPCSVADLITDSKPVWGVQKSVAHFIEFFISDLRVPMAPSLAPELERVQDPEEKPTSHFEVPYTVPMSMPSSCQDIFFANMDKDLKVQKHSSVEFLLQQEQHCDRVYRIHEKTFAQLFGDIHYAPKLCGLKTEHFGGELPQFSASFSRHTQDISSLTDQDLVQRVFSTEKVAHEKILASLQACPVEQPPHPYAARIHALLRITYALTKQPALHPEGVIASTQDPKASIYNHILQRKQYHQLNCYVNDSSDTMLDAYVRNTLPLQPVSPLQVLGAWLLHWSQQLTTTQLRKEST